MKILILSDNFYPYHKGGGDLVPLFLAREYLKKGNQISVICTVNEKKITGREILDGMTIFRLYSNYHPRWRAYVGVLNFGAVRKLKKILIEEKPDIIHAHNLHQNLSFCALKLIRKLNIPLILTIHDCLPFCYKKFTCCINDKDLSVYPESNYKKKTLKCLQCQKFRFFPLRNYLIRYFLKFPDKIIAVSTEQQKVLRANKVRCDDFIHNGIDPNSFNCREEQQKFFLQKFNLEGKKIILGVGRLHPAKGFEYIIKALPNIHQKEKNVVFVLISQKNSYANYLLKLVEKLKLKNNFLITGWLQREDLNPIFCASNLVVYPSVYFDSFGLVNLEAMAAKKPVIATCFGGPKEIVLDGTTGYIVNPFNTKDLSEKIIELLANPQKAKTFGERGCERLKEKFLVRYQAEHYLKLMEELIKSGAKHLSSK